MNLSRTAIRYELSSGSTAMLLRLWLRFLLLWIVIWAASDLFFVWYWTGRLVPGAHQYFGRWFLAWFFTQKVPLYFLSLPSLPELALLFGALVRRVVRLIQHLGSGTGDPDSRRARLLLAPRSRGPSRGEASARPQPDPSTPALTRTSPHRAPERPRGSLTRPSAHSSLDRVRAFPHHGRDRSEKVDGHPLAAAPDPGSRRARDRGRSRVRIPLGILSSGARRPDSEPDR